MLEEKSIFLGNQEEVYNQIQDFLNKPGKGLGLIQGAAGFGKTYLVTLVISSLIKDNKYPNIGVLAPTGQAVKVCRDNASEYSSKVRYGTIHSAFAMKPDKQSEELTFIQDKNITPWATDQDILFVDEVSQLDDQLFFFLVDYLEVNDAKVILIGDKYQIPPINHKFSIPFMKKGVKEFDMQYFKLTEPIRQKEGSLILDNADIIRENIKMAHIYLPEDRISLRQVDAIYHLDQKKINIFELLEEWYLDPRFKENPYFVKVIAWHRQVVASWNEMIRKILFGSIDANIEDHRSMSIKKIVVGDRLVSAGPVVEKIETGEEKVIFPNNTDLIVLSYTDDRADIDGSGKYILEYHDTVVSYISELGQTKTHNIKILSRKSEKLYNKLLKSLSESANEAHGKAKSEYWADFWELKSLFANISYGYARTGHTVQGSTYENAIVLEFDIMTNRNILERNRILYVACTRPKNTLIQIY